MPMPIPFPGMNPYLEHPDLWPTVHQRLIATLADVLWQRLPAIYRVRSHTHRYQVSGEDALIVGAPSLSWENVFTENVVAEAKSSDAFGAQAGASASHTASDTASHTASDTASHPIPVLVPVPQKIYETYLEIIDETGSAVTIIEMLSPKKKRPGRGRALYERQREAIFGSDVHFVEIDLLRGWEPPSIYGPEDTGDYRILVSRSEQRPRAQLFTWTVLEPIPTIVLPLKGDDGLALALKPVVDKACDRTDLLVNYQQAPLPPLRQAENRWLETFLQQVGMRPCAS